MSELSDPIFSIIPELLVTSEKISNEEKGDAAGDIATIHSQLTKQNPDKGIIKPAWNSLQKFATIGGADTELFEGVKTAIEFFLK